MIHRVVWEVEAVQSLEEIWDAAFDQESIAHAIDVIEEELSEDAMQMGESRDEGFRVYFAPPLAVLYWANDRATEVIIEAVWTIR
jgi:hypothetical protein